jgi:putative hydrolase of the HAD superfamily
MTAGDDDATGGDDRRPTQYVTSPATRRPLPDPDAPVDAVLFDVDDTLCRYRRPGAELLPLAFDRVGVEPFFDVEDYHERYPEFLATAEDVASLREACFASLAAERDRDPAVGRRVARAYAAERDHRNVRPLPGARAAVERLAADHRLGVVTNGGPSMQREKLDALGLGDAFETVVHAGYDTAPKPDPEPFERALGALGVDPERAVHVGNSHRSDVAGGRAAGVRAAWLPDAAASSVDTDPEPTYTLASMADLHAPPWRG